MDDMPETPRDDRHGDKTRPILSVSYGAFSCTLEGFDDPMAVVRELTAWFEDVARRDRLFGADGDTVRTLRAEGFDIDMRSREDRAPRLRIANGGEAVGAGGADIVCRLAGLRDAMPLGEGTPERHPPTVDDDFDGMTDDEDGRAAEEGAIDRVPQDATIRASGDAEDGAGPDDGLTAALSAALHDGADNEGPEEAQDGPAETIRDLAVGPPEAQDVETRRPRRIRRVRMLREAEAPPTPGAADEHEDEDEIGALLSAAADDEEEGGPDLRALGWDTSADGADADRLFDAVETRMAEDDARRRQDGHAAMRAAAMHGVSEEEPDADVDRTDDTFRADLADTIRPRRAPPRGDAHATQRPATHARDTPGHTSDDISGGAKRDADGPLRLTAAERMSDPIDGEKPYDRPVDPAKDAPAVAVRPRRVRRAIESDDDTRRLLAAVGASSQDTDEDAFRTFAEENRAETMPDVIEAAAAFTMLQTGDDAISRRQMLALAGEFRPDAHREDGLHAFGRLLRTGHLRKTEGGLFALTDESRFYTIARREVI